MVYKRNEITTKDLAVKVFEDWKKASNWYYNAKIKAFGDKTPVQMVLDGREEEVREFLYRIAYGVFG